MTFPKSPHFIIIGAQKAGTTALSTLLDMHPLLKGTTAMEAHFFDEDTKFLLHKDHLDDEIRRCKVQRRYHQHYWSPVTEGDRGKLYFEKTPRYLFWPNVPKYIRQVCPWKPKIIVLLRDPIERLSSHHNMNAGRNQTTANYRLDNAINREVYWMRQANLTRAPLLGETRAPNNDNNNNNSEEAEFAIPPLTVTERQRIVRNMLDNDKETAEFWLMQRGMYAVQLEAWLASSSSPQSNNNNNDYQVGVNLLAIQYERLQRDPVRVWHEVQDFLQVPRHELEPHVLRGDYSPTKNKSGTRDPQQQFLSQATREYLKKFYHPYNERLADLLGEEWRGVWD